MHATIINVLSICVFSVSSIGNAELDKHLSTLPHQSIICANLIRNGKWYILNSSELSVVKKSLLEKKRYRLPEGVDDAVFGPLNIRIVLWGVADGKLEPLDFIEMDENASLLYNKQGTLVIKNNEASKPLRELMKRIKDGKEKPVAISSPNSNSDSPGPRNPRNPGGPAKGAEKAPVKAGKESRMKEPYGKGLATRPGPESCAGVVVQRDYRTE